MSIKAIALPATPKGSPLQVRVSAMPSTLILYVLAGLAGWGVVAPVATYFGSQWKTQIEERAACSIRVKSAVDTVAREVNEAADRAISAAEDAASAVLATPTAPAELAALCNADKHCRGRKP